MDQTIKQEWVSALRSGEYEQGRGYLKDRDGKLCCLGVLCEIAARHGIIEPGRTTYEDAEAYAYGEERDDIYLPAAVQEWQGLDRSPHANNKSLADLNDGGTPFSDIADLIEAHL